MMGVVWSATGGLRYRWGYGFVLFFEEEFGM